MKFAKSNVLKLKFKVIQTQYLIDIMLMSKFILRFNRAFGFLPSKIHSKTHSILNSNTVLYTYS